MAKVRYAWLHKLSIHHVHLRTIHKSHSKVLRNRKICRRSDLY